MAKLGTAAELKHLSFTTGGAVSRNQLFVRFAGQDARLWANSATLIRDRFRVLGDISTFTAQGKMTAVILVSLPIMVGTVTYMAAPDYFTPMLTTEEAIPG